MKKMVFVAIPKKQLKSLRKILELMSSLEEDYVPRGPQVVPEMTDEDREMAEYVDKHFDDKP